MLLPPLPVLLRKCHLPPILELDLGEHVQSRLTMHDRAARSKPAVDRTECWVTDTATRLSPLHLVAPFNQKPQWDDRLHLLQGQQGAVLWMAIQNCSTCSKFNLDGSHLAPFIRVCSSEGMCCPSVKECKTLKTCVHGLHKDLFQANRFQGPERLEESCCFIKEDRSGVNL